MKEARKNKEKAGKVSEVGRKWLSEEAYDLKRTSIVKYEDILRCYINPTLGETELSDISNEQLVSFVNMLKSEGGSGGQPLSESTIAEAVSIMNRLRIYAMRNDCKILYSTECISLRKAQPDIRVFSIEEENRLIEYCHKNLEPVTLGILIALYTGLRIGEVCALLWSDINLIDNALRVSKTMYRLRSETSASSKTVISISEPKSKCSKRVIPIPVTLADILKPFYAPSAYLLTGECNQFVEPRTMQNRFKKILIECDIADANFHATRHTFATRCVELGFDIKSLSAILGHSNVAFTMNRYVHPTMALKAENMNKLCGLFDGLGMEA